MTSQTRWISSLGAADASEAVGWGWRTAAAPERSRRTGLPLALGSLALALLTFVFVAGCGFIAFVATLERYERDPQRRADAIVALTGGAQRIGDAIDLLAKGYGAPPPDHRRQRAHEPAGDRPPQPRAAPALRLLRRPRLPGPQHRRQRRRDAALDGRQPLRLAHRRDLELPHAAHARSSSTLRCPAPRRCRSRSCMRARRPTIGGGTPTTARLLASEYVKYVAGWLRTRVEREAPAARPAPVRVAAEREAR